MKLQNGYKVIYEKIADGTRAFFADKLDGTDAVKIGNTTFKVGEYKLVFEKDGGIFGSKTGAVEDGTRITAFDDVFVAEDDAEPMMANLDDGDEQPAASGEGDDDLGDIDEDEIEE